MTIKRFRKVYVVYGVVDYEGDEVLAIYKSRKNAEKLAEEVRANGFKRKENYTSHFDSVGVVETEVLP